MSKLLRSFIRSINLPGRDRSKLQEKERRRNWATITSRVQGSGKIYLNILRYFELDVSSGRREETSNNLTVSR